MTGHPRAYGLRAIEVIGQPEPRRLARAAVIDQPFDGAPGANEEPSDPVVRRIPTVLLPSHMSILLGQVILHAIPVKWRGLPMADRAAAKGALLMDVAVGPTLVFYAGIGLGILAVAWLLRRRR